MRAALEQRLDGFAPSVRFHGAVPHPVVLSALASARVAVFPSFAEAFGLAPLEAMAHACPTIFSRRGSGPELICDGRDGLLVDPSNPEADRRRHRPRARRRRPRRAPRRRRPPPRHRRFLLGRSAGKERRLVSIVPETLPQELKALPGWRIAALASAAASPAARSSCPPTSVPRPCPSLLTALAALPDPPEEVVIVDGSPHAPHGCGGLRVGRRPPALPFDLVYARAPRGLTRQRNAGIDLCAGRYVFFLDDDALPEPGYFNAIRRAFEAARELGGHRRRHRQPDGPPDFPPLAHPPRAAPGASRRARASIIPAAPPPRAACSSRSPGCAKWTCSPAAPSPSAARCSTSSASPNSSPATRRARTSRCRLRVGRRWKLASCGEARVIAPRSRGRPAGGFAKGRMEVRNRYFIWKRHVPHPRAVRPRPVLGGFAFLAADGPGLVLQRPWHGAWRSRGLAAAPPAAWPAAAALRDSPAPPPPQLRQPSRPVRRPLSRRPLPAKPIAALCRTLTILTRLPRAAPPPFTGR